MLVLPCGEQAALVELSDLTEVLGLYATLRREPLEGVTELLPAARTLLLRFDRRITGVDRIAVELGGRPIGPAEDHYREEITIEVRYDGEDLEEVASLSGLHVREVVERHVEAAYTSAFCGFAPGFAYLVGLHPSLWVPRRDSPRTRVPTGAVAIADEYAAIYPRESPGGWRVIGHTDAPVWDLERTPPTLLAPGTPVRFVEVTA
ncbi:5-oxoprolinase subunit B family protein [Pedococcus sp. P5_B7]